MPAHLIQAMPMLVLGLAALAGIAVTWLRGRRVGGQQAATARRDLAVALALAACWAGIWVLYATYTWTAAPDLSTLQSARFYVPALGAISLLGAWLLVRVPRSQPLAAITTLAIVAALFGLGNWAFHDMYQHPFGSQLVVVPGPGGTVELEPGPEAGIGTPAAPPGRPAPAAHHHHPDKPTDASRARMPVRNVNTWRALSPGYSTLRQHGGIDLFTGWAVEIKAWSG
jgi:hypothetical protein